MSIERIGVVGAGQMGSGIAHVLALAGYDVVLADLTAEALDNSIAMIRRNMSRQAARPTIHGHTLRPVVHDRDIEPAMARIKPVTGLDALANCDLVIEAAFEDEALKKAIFQELAAKLKPEAIIATNT